MAFKYNPFTGDFDRVDISSGPPGSTTEFPTDAGTAIPAGGDVNILGDASQGCTTSGAGNTVTITNTNASISQIGVTELATSAETIAGTDVTRTVVPRGLTQKLGLQTAQSIPFGAGNAAALGWTGALSDGQLAIGSTAGTPAAGAITSLDASVTITLGSNTIDLSAAGGGAATTYDGDTGSATPAANILTIAGGTLLGTTAAGSTVTINADDNVVGSVGTDSGTVTPTSNNFDIVGAGTITTAGSGATVTITGTSTHVSMPWTTITFVGPTTMAVNNGYIPSGIATIGLTLPATAAVGDIIRVSGNSVNGWTIGQNAAQTIHFGNQDSTSGVGGSLASTARYDSVELLCISTNTQFSVLSSIGNITVT